MSGKNGPRTEVPKAVEDGSAASDEPAAAGRLIRYLPVEEATFVNSAPFRDAVRRLGLELLVDTTDGQTFTLGADEELDGDMEADVDLFDPATQASLGVMRFFDLHGSDSDWRPCEVSGPSPAFTTVLKLMDEYSIDDNRPRAFIDAHGDEVHVGSPGYCHEFDFATGRYKDA